MKCGLKTFPFPVTLTDEISLVEMEYGVKGYAVVVKLFQAIFSRGYYMDWSIDTELLFIRDYCLSEVGRSTVSEIVACCIRRGVFESTSYEKYHILTSKRIQETFLTATARNKEVIFDARYALPFVFDFVDNANKNGKNVNIFFKNADILQQKKRKEKKEKEISLSNTTREDFIEKWHIADTRREEPENVDYKRLSEEFANSEWLQHYIRTLDKVFDLYEKIIIGYYRTYKTPAKTEVFHSRLYTKQELDALIDNIEDIEI